MFKRVLILRYGEIYLKGKNRGYFERLLKNNIMSVLEGEVFSFTTIPGRYLVYDYTNESRIIEKLKNVFGLTSISIATEINSLEKDIFKHLKTIAITTNSFKVVANRADKDFILTSQEMAIKAGGIILENNKNVKVDVHNPETIIEIDIRENNKTYVSSGRIAGVGGMPVGSAGEGLVMLSGGIDSPVAGYQINKRGMHNTYIHFYSYPYTSTQAKDKVIELAKLLKSYNGKSKILFVPFTKIQEQIHKNCDSSFMITLMRRFMFKIASKVCEEYDYQTIITGESLGQVASQTIESITTSNASAGIIPVLRPLISFDKEETVALAKKIKSYPISILPYEDCCTIFLPKNPVIKPKLHKVEKQESYLNIDDLINEAIKNIEVLEL